jgi:hypothetical protein
MTSSRNSRKKAHPEPDMRIERAGTAAEPIRRVRSFLLKELREMAPPTIFFFIGFNIIILTTNLVLAEYLASVGNFMLATASALIVGKAVLIANAMPFLRRYDQRPLIQPILFKSIFYWAIVALVRVLEHFIEFSLVDHNPVNDFPAHMITTFSWHRFTAIQIWILVLFLIYVSASELNDLLGKGEMWRALFGREPSKLQLMRHRT